MSKEAYYFSHDANARNDEKVLMLRADHGWEGYGVYWALLEMMFENADTKLSHNKIKGIAISYNINITVLNDVINTCISESLFVSDGDKFWSESLLRRKGKYQEIKEKKSAAGKKGMEKRWGNKQKDNTVITDDNTDITENNKGKEMKLNKLNKIKEEDNIPFADIVDHLNLKAGTKYKTSTQKTKTLIAARWESGFRLGEFKTVINKKVAEWKGTDYEKYLRPETLFGNKFEAYVNQNGGGNSGQNGGNYGQAKKTGGRQYETTLPEFNYKQR